jgi:hypothetical protein
VLFVEINGYATSAVARWIGLPTLPLAPRRYPLIRSPSSLELVKVTTGIGRVCAAPPISLRTLLDGLLVGSELVVDRFLLVTDASGSPVGP